MVRCLPGLLRGQRRQGHPINEPLQRALCPPHHPHPVLDIEGQQVAVVLDLLQFHLEKKGEELQRCVREREGVKTVSVREDVLGLVCGISVCFMC